jgi:hypothetical protein
VSSLSRFLFGTLSISCRISNPFSGVQPSNFRPDFLFLPFLPHFFSNLSSVFYVRLLRFQGTYLGTLNTSWLEYFRFGNSLLPHRSWVSHFLSFGSEVVRACLWCPVVLQGNVHPLIWVMDITAFGFRVWQWFWDSGQIFWKKFEALIHLPSGRRFWSFNTVTYSIMLTFSWTSVWFRKNIYHTLWLLDYFSYNLC